ncbi:MAG: ribose 5-phosphate isomerase B [Alphaproteobacteria bacterium]|nr:ribose 5-phosphate isomerase B [Alphaproteobacteria bacterium]
MNIAIASDHAGAETKNFIADFLKNKNINIVDLGCDGTQSVDYPLYADKLADYIIHNPSDLGILVCGTGIGISIRANRHKGIRAALLYSDEVAEMVKKHNNANVMVFGGRTMSKEDIAKRIDIFLNTEFEGGRHQKRIDMLDM